MKKVIVVTGAGKGFGRQLAIDLSRDYTVVAVSRTESDLESLKEELDVGIEIKTVCTDVADFKLSQEKVKQALAEIDEPVYGLINNAGVRCRRAFLELSLDEISDVLNVNLLAAMNLASVLLPHMLAGGEGRIINISSILSQKALPDLSAYAVSKGALDAFTRSMAVEFGGRNITSNSILPGFCKTSYYEKFSENLSLMNMTLDRTPMGRWGEENEIIGICRFLLTGEAGYVNGSSIPIDGGWLA